MAKTNQQIIVTEGDFGVEILTQIIDANKKPVPIEGCSCKIKFAYNGNVISERTGIVIDEPKGIVSVILDTEETQYSGLWTSYWICYDQFNNVTTTENIYYYVQPAIGSVNNPAFTELLNYYNRDEVNNIFKSILEQLNNYTLTKDDVEEYIKIYAQDKIDDDFVRQCIVDAIGNGSDYVKKQDFTTVSNNLHALSQRVDRYNQSLEQEDINLSNNIQTVQSNLNSYKTSFESAINTIKKETEVKNSKIVYKAISGTLNDSSIYIKDTDITHLKNIGADLTLCVMCSTTSETDNNIEIMDNERVIRTIERCTAQGVNVNMIKPHIGLNFSDTLNRKNYNPTDKNLFFENWTNVLLNYASICNTYNIPMLCISVEMVELTKNIWADNWKRLYEDIKSEYPNVKLLHAPKNWEFADEGNELSLQYCDILGCTFYSHYTHKPFSKTDRIDIKELGKSFYYTDDNYRFMELVNTRCKKYNKEFYIMEIGCMALDDGLTDVVPDSYKSTTTRDNFNVQAALMKAFFKYCLPNENIIGFNWWHIRNPFEFYKDDEITIAEQTMKDYCKRGVVND